MEYHLFHWYSIGEMHLIIRPSGGAFYLSIGTIGIYDLYQYNIYIIGIPLVKCISNRDSCV